MNLEELTLHLNDFHKKVITTMSPVMDMGPLIPIELIVRPLAFGGCLCAPNSPDTYKFKIYISQIGSIREDYQYSDREIVGREFTTAHETGYYFHFQNPRFKEESNELKIRPISDRRRNRIINY